MSSQEHAPTVEEMNSTPRFPLFPSLPPELRIQIWQHSLPNIGPALYTYRYGCWEPRCLTEDDHDYAPGSDDYNWLMEFRHDRLGSARLNVALVSVNSEARDVALQWAAAQGIEVLRGEDGGPVLVRCFNPERDAMYVSPDDWYGFLAEEIEMPYELGWDRLERSFESRCEVTRLAVPEAFFTRCNAVWRDLSELCTLFSSVEALYVVAGPLRDMPHPWGGREAHPPWRCEMDDLRGPEVFWDHDDETWLSRGAVQAAQTPAPCDGVVEQAAQELRRGLVELQTKAFRVRKVYLVK